MRIMALDIGDSKIGVAISDPLRIIAQGIDPVKRTNVSKDIEVIKELIEKYEIVKLVVGLPKTLEGEIGIQAQKVINFVELLASSLDVPVIFWDERYTTVVANKTLISADVRRNKRKEVVDKLSAVLILQGYLDSHSNAEENI